MSPLSKPDSDGNIQHIDTKQVVSPNENKCIKAVHTSSPYICNFLVLGMMEIIELISIHSKFIAGDKSSQNDKILQLSGNQKMPWFTKNPKYFHFIPYYVQGYLHKAQNEKKIFDES